MIDERTGSCIICMVRDAFEPPACGPCRSRLAGQLRDIPALVDELTDPPGADPDAPRSEDLRYPPGHEDEGKVVPLALELLPAAAVPGQSGAPRVHGSREAPVPISVDRTDLLSDARVLNLTKAYEQQREDQIGYLSAATTLDGWCRDFAETRRESVPEPIPHEQCRYLGDRLGWAFAEHAAVDEFAGEVADLWHALRRAAGLTEPQPELCVGIPCRRVECDVKALWKIPGSDWVECASCGLLMSQVEYASWCRLLAASARKTVVPAP